MPGILVGWLVLGILFGVLIVLSELSFLEGAGVAQLVLPPCLPMPPQPTVVIAEEVVKAFLDGLPGDGTDAGTGVVVGPLGCCFRRRRRSPGLTGIGTAAAAAVLVQVVGVAYSGTGNEVTES